ncbi:DUF1667 domain-containing protein [Caproicibacterium lactatifermentans]|uniref:DUF1667 domain-containing protein n=1 Tax=Caproicibacterium lactatifermentans TaxID=2666138 RepID=A0A859DMQ8_9FIRM|nr:DUF1667 domain-containing protein [Caproicibacterium lactatifermentans]QKN23016.1 DUF1667 domain-containing protein [Caproicibacterium lactatifermentans]
MKEIICTCCPKGCRLQVDEMQDYRVTGNGCPNGAVYGRQEATNPVRIVTSTVSIRGGLHPRCPVKTEQAVPKKQVPAVMKALEKVELQAPVSRGQVVLQDICGTGVNLITTRSM